MAAGPVTLAAAGSKFVLEAFHVSRGWPALLTHVLVSRDESAETGKGDWRSADCSHVGTARCDLGRGRVHSPTRDR